MGTRRLTRYLLLMLCTLLPLPAQAQDDAALKKLFADYWQCALSASPTNATYLGDHRYDDRLDDVSESAVRRWYDSLRVYQKRITAIDDSKLSARDLLNKKLFVRNLETEFAAEPLKNYQMPLGQQNGIHLDLPQLPFSHPFETVRDYENFLKRLKQFPVQVEETIQNIRAGIAEKRVPPKFIVERIVPQIEAGILADASQSPLYDAVKKIPKTFLTADSVRFAKAISKEITQTVTPAYRKLLDFVKTQYLPAARTDAGIWALPDGAARYQHAILSHTTTALTADEIHAIGVRELAKVHAEMQGIMKKVGFTGTLQAFNQSLRTDPQFYFDSPDSLEAYFRKILTTIDAKLPQLFSRLPKARYDLKRLEPYREASAPAAYYYSPSEDGSRPGYFYYNAYRLDSRPKYTMEVLAYHEAVPGHHLQIALALENKDLPEFRRHEGYTAFVEGWGLYSERLPKELGAYSDAYSDFGRLTFDAWRCCRLIVDTGIHYKRWTREQAIEFMKNNTSLSAIDITSEVERYIAWPGQALAYKLGQLKILELRAKAETELGKKFDIKAFHEIVLGDGAVPLGVLEEKIDAWIAAEKSKI